MVMVKAVCLHSCSRKMKTTDVFIINLGTRWRESFNLHPSLSLPAGPLRTRAAIVPRRTTRHRLPFAPQTHSHYHPHMTIDMKSLAREGAKARLWQLETETNELLRAFPDLRDGQHSQTTSKDGSRRGRREMTAAERRSVSVRMKKYWAGRRKNNTASAS